MTRKTYGVPGKIETVLVLRAGASRAVIAFKGGSIVDFARKPACYATSDPLHQAIIENSEQFRRGEIRLLSAIDMGGDAADAAPADAPAGAGAALAAGAVGAAGDGVALEEVRVATKADAVEWLKGKFPEKGYTATSLRTSAALEASAQECGVRFVIG